MPNANDSLFCYFANFERVTSFGVPGVPGVPAGADACLGSVTIYWAVLLPIFEIFPIFPNFLRLVLSRLATRDATSMQCFL